MVSGLKYISLCGISGTKFLVCFSIRYTSEVLVVGHIGGIILLYHFVVSTCDRTYRWYNFVVSILPITGPDTCVVFVFKIKLNAFMWHPRLV